MNDTNMGAGMVYDTPEEKQIAKLEARLAEVEKAHEAESAKLGNELFKAKAEKTWGCGHTNHGSCSQCLGHVTNERNALLRKLHDSEIVSEIVLAKLGNELFKVREELEKAREVVWYARKILETASSEDHLVLKWSLSNALHALDATRATEEKK